jgi:eukaryotic-like serine/threonine-protein kinase
MKFVKNKGSGGFGNVDIMEDANGNRYARKTFSVNQPGGLSPEMTENVKKRFIREAQIQSKINHPNIVSVHSMDIASDPPSYIMELATSTLAEDIAVDKSLGGNYLSAVMDILAGLEELHSMATTHRDLKPQNVLRFNGRYAISDFGLVSLKETQLSVTDYYRHGEGVGLLHRSRDYI